MTRPRRPPILSLVLLLAAAVTTTVLADNDGTCSATKACTSGCCSSSGYCGFGPNYCGDSCISSCDATAECGQYAAVPGTTCPLNVCCSGCGFCGTTSEFCSESRCDNTCQSGCDTVSKPSCSSAGGTATKKTIGYYESWSKTRSCGQWLPSDIDSTKWTHLNYAFALIDESTFSVAQMNDFDTELYTQFTGLKSKNPALSVFISVGGWDAGGEIFSSMCSTAANRAAFIASMKQFLVTYSFDGVDIDWEYPVTSDRGGSDADFVNYVTFLQELREALGSAYGITATLPSSYWYMKGFDIVGMEPYLDWFNIMTYDIHGTWDGNNPYTSAIVQAHTNLTEIDQSLDLLWRNGIDSSKVVLGLGFYGRSFTLKDPSCTSPGCPFSGGANPGKCTATSGILSNAEIQDIISENNLTPILDEDAAAKYIVWDSDQWVSYDDTETLKTKMDYANNLCLGGTMVWALDLDSVGTDTSINSLGVSGTDGSDDAASIKLRTSTYYSNSLTLGLFWTVCLPKDTYKPCPDGYRAIAFGHGKVFDADLQYATGEGCHGGGVNGFQRALCAASNIGYSSLQWGPGANSKACNSKCPNGWVTLTKNSHLTGQKTGCKSGKYAPLCVYEITVVQNSNTCFANTLGHILSGGLSLRTDEDAVTDFDFEDTEDIETSSAVEKFRAIRARKLQAKKKRQVYGGALCGGTLPLGDIPIEIPGVLNRYRNGVNTYYSIQPTSPRISATTTSKPTSTVFETTTATEYSTTVRTCDGAKYPQACYHYSSVAQMSTFSHATCSNQDQSLNLRPLTKSYNDGHANKRWFSFIPVSYTNANGKRRKINCQRDEWPPAHFQQGRADGWIRLLPGDQNGGIPNDAIGGWRGFCKFPPSKQVKKEGGPITDMVSYYLLTSYTSTIVTLNVLSYTWKNMNPPAGDPYGLTDNKCRPYTLTADVGFALQTDDAWYGNVRLNDYNSDPGAKTVGKTQPDYRRRWVDDEDDDADVYFDYRGGVVTADNGNSTRLATDEELEELGYTRCESPDCLTELEMLRSAQAEADMATETAAATATLVQALTTATATTALSGPGTPMMGSETRPTLVAAASMPAVTAGGGSEELRKA